MLSQGWMGSDFTNDDLLKAASIVEDYVHTLIGSQLCNGEDCYKIKLVPKPNAAIVWGSLIKWVSKKGYFQMKTEYYDEDNLLVKTESASNIKLMGDREIPTHFEIIPAEKPGNKTIVDFDKMKFNIPIEEGFFSQQNMKDIR
jgi:outer membrane lipoprotein-sorting protein